MLAATVHDLFGVCFGIDHNAVDPVIYDACCISMCSAVFVRILPTPPPRFGIVNEVRLFSVSRHK